MLRLVSGCSAGGVRRAKWLKNGVKMETSPVGQDKKEQPVGSKRGFSSMDPQKQKEIASKGGKAARQKGTAHEFTSEEARVAGKKGGAARRERRGGTLPPAGELQPIPENMEQEPSGSAGEEELREE